MKTVIYPDVLYLVNFVIALFLLCGCALICGAECRTLRLLASSAAAGASSMVLLLPEQPLPVQILYQVCAAAVIVRIAFRWGGVRIFLRQCIWYFVLNLTSAGFVILLSMRGYRLVQTNNLACYYNISPLLLLGCIAGTYFALRAIQMLFGRPLEKTNCSFRIKMGDSDFSANACYDTGFTVRDTITGLPTILFSYDAVKRNIPPEVRSYLDAYFRKRENVPIPPPELRFRLIECGTVAGTIMLPAVPADEFTLKIAGQSRAGSRVIAVFTDQAMEDTRYAALIGPELIQYSHRRKDKDEYAIGEKDSAAVGKAESFSAASLHRKGCLLRFDAAAFAAAPFGGGGKERFSKA